MTQQVRKGYRNHKKGTWAAVLVVLAAAAATFAVASSSAGTTTKPYTAYFSPTATTGQVTLTITNLADPQSLGSANVTAPASLSITQASPASVLASDQTFPTSVLKLRNLGIAPGDSAYITLYVSTCVSGNFTWGIRAKQSNDFSGPPGNDFNFKPEGSNLVTSVTGTCSLRWVTQPAWANVNTYITGTDYAPTAPKAQVEVWDGTQRVTSINSGNATLSRTGGGFDSTGAFQNASEAFVNGLATFNTLQASGTGKDFTLQAADSLSRFLPSASSGPFTITLNGAACTASGCPSISATTGNTQVDASATGSSFTLLAISTTTPPPPTVTGAGGGCQYFKPAGDGFEAFDRRSSATGDLLFTYYVRKTNITKLYGTSQGQQFIPLCAGAGWVDSSGAVKKCTDVGAPAPWKGKELGTDGKFTANTRDAVCGAGGLYWGILGSFQDYNAADPIDPLTSPTVTGWDSNNTYRYFHVRVPAPWDWKMT